jgi:hypothetical protein
MKTLLTFSLPLLLIASTLSAAPLQQAPMPSLPTEEIVELRDIKDVIVLPGVNPLWYWLAGGITLLGLLIILFFFLKNRQKRVHILLAHEKAMDDLQAARSLMTTDNARPFAITMANILRSYIEDRFQLPVQKLTTREFLGQLITSPEDLPAELQQHKQMLDDWLTHCDLVKFARYSLSETEMEDMFDSVTDFITATKPQDKQT